MATKAPKCRFCGKAHWANCDWGASNIASNKEENDASNTAPPVVDAEVAIPASREAQPKGAVAVGEVLGEKQRWDRAAYNAYQREYMRAYRERKKNG